MKYAFRCKTCGRLHAAEHAGENEIPHACCVCGSGVQYGPNFKDIATRLCDPALTPEQRTAIAQEVAAAQNNLVKTYQLDNWEVLADCTPEQLKEYGLVADDVERHIASDPRGFQVPPSGPMETVATDKGPASPPLPKAVFVGAAEGSKAKDRA